MQKEKSVCAMWGLALLLGAVVIFGGLRYSSAQVNLNFNLGSSPPQEVIATPGGVYYVPNQSAADVFFNNGYWWATRDNQWYRSNDYNGTWKVIDQRYVPAPIYKVYQVPNYREFYEKQEGKRIPYGQWKKQGYKFPYGQAKKQQNMQQVPNDQWKKQEGDHRNKNKKDKGKGGGHGKGN